MTAAMRRKLIALFAGAVVLVGASGCPSASAPSSDPQQPVEIEIDIDGKKVRTPAPVVKPVQPPAKPVAPPAAPAPVKPPTKRVVQQIRRSTVFEIGDKVRMTGVPVVVEVLGYGVCGDEGCNEETVLFADPETGEDDCIHASESERVPS